jgi:hypothetical protein
MDDIIGHRLFKAKILLPAMLNGHKELLSSMREKNAQGGGMGRALTLPVVSTAWPNWLAA